ncbi:hypothetical protein Franean1_1483 [Parafrankia sp. EAN1pec]|uniref:hypothetical protein n=1 Tax=Parafrankia sp. (strain EAN1pec) TaxID=298653 RepID=UPI0000541712|nr:hypothetical protein Franean1_1483 [Frankia sp. EAN1pec]
MRRRRAATAGVGEPTASASAPQVVETAVVSATPVAAETPATPTGSAAAEPTAAGATPEPTLRLVVPEAEVEAQIGPMRRMWDAGGEYTPDCPGDLRNEVDAEMYCLGTRAEDSSTIYVHVYVAWVSGDKTGLGWSYPAPSPEPTAGTTAASSP